MPQLSYTQNAIAAQPGMAFDAESSTRDVVSRICAVNIPFGVYCELDSNGLAVPMKDATTGGSFLPQSLGISMFDPLGVEQSYVPFSVPATTGGSSSVGWLKGMAAPFMRQGRIWVAGDSSGTVQKYGAINVWHSSDGTHKQGVFTNLAVSATAGAEIDIAPSCIEWNPDLLGGNYTDPFGNVFSVYPVEIKL
jgi:hypothetical protein